MYQCHHKFSSNWTLYLCSVIGRLMNKSRKKYFHDAGYPNMTYCNIFLLIHVQKTLWYIFFRKIILDNTCCGSGGGGQCTILRHVSWGGVGVIKKFLPHSICVLYLGCWVKIWFFHVIPVYYIWGVGSKSDFST